MPTNYKSPFATTFKNAVKRGTAWHVAVENIAKKNSKTTTYVWNSLFKAGLVNRVKFSGQWLYWPVDGGKTTATNCKNFQWNMWQWFINWSIASGFCTQKQFMNNKGSQKEFMNFCKKFFNKQFKTTTTTSKKRGTTKARRRPTVKKTRNTTTSRRKTTKGRTYKFPTAKSRTTRRYSRAA